MMIGESAVIDDLVDPVKRAATVRKMRYARPAIRIFFVLFFIGLYFVGQVAGLEAGETLAVLALFVPFFVMFEILMILYLAFERAGIGAEPSGATSRSNMSLHPMPRLRLGAADICRPDTPSGAPE